MRSIFRYQFEIVAILLFQLFLLVAAIIQLFLTSGRIDYLIVTLFTLSVVVFSFLMVDGLYKKVVVEGDKIAVKSLIGRTIYASKEQIIGYQCYKTIGALGPEESLYIHLANDRKIGIHGKAYKNFPSIKKSINNMKLPELESYDFYKNTYLRQLKVALPIAFFISIVLFAISKVI